MRNANKKNNVATTENAVEVANTENTENTSTENTKFVAVARDAAIDYVSRAVKSAQNIPYPKMSATGKELLLLDQLCRSTGLAREKVCYLAVAYLKAMVTTEEIAGFTALLEAEEARRKEVEKAVKEAEEAEKAKEAVLGAMTVEELEKLLQARKSATADNTDK